MAEDFANTIIYKDTSSIILAQQVNGYNTGSCFYQAYLCIYRIYSYLDSANNQQRLLRSASRLLKTCIMDLALVVVVGS
jgi:hypothetical protein